MQIKLVRYFLAVAHERHFARAAAACNVSQPTLSAGLAALEEQVGKRLVDRDRRFIGLTAAGEAALPWAQQLIAASENLARASDASEGLLRGELRLGAIPASMPVTGHLTRALLATYPQLSISVRSMTSREIERDLASFELDAGITYLDHEPPANMLTVPLYTEHYLFVMRSEGRPRRSEAMGWAEATAYPLSLLHQGMQNRRILDAMVAERGLALIPKVTADSYVALLAMVRDGDLATIIPSSHAAILSGIDWATILPFDEPGPGSRIGLIVPDKVPTTAIAGALISVGSQMRLPAQFHRA